MAFPHVFARIDPRLRDWVLRHGMSPPEVAELYTDEEIGSGEAVLGLEEELEIGDHEVEHFRKDFEDLLVACADHARRQHARLAAVPVWQIHLEQQAKRRRAWRESELQSMDEREDSKLRQVPPPPPSAPRYGTSRRRGAALEGDANGRQKAEDAERAKWLARLGNILQELDASALREAGCSDSRRLVQALVGGRRASTIRARVRTWEQYRRWLLGARGLGHPRCAGDFLDYAFDRAAEPCSRGVIRGALDMLRFAEEMMGTASGERISDMPLVRAAVKGLMSGAAPTGPGRRGGQAPRPFVKMIIMLENLIVDEGAVLFDRLLAWWMVFSVWGVLRFDDHRGLVINEIKEVQGGWNFMLLRSKTTGPDKAVQVRPGVVARGAYIRQQGWCEVGLRLWAAAAPGARDYALCAPGPDGGCLLRELGYAEYAGRIRGVLAKMRADSAVTLGADVASFLSPHSFRAFLPSVAASIGAPPQWLGWISGWKAKGAETYVRTSRQRTAVLQTVAARVARDFLNGGDPFGEHDLHCELDAYLQERGVSDADRQSARESLLGYPWPPVTELLWNKSDEQEQSGSAASSSAAASNSAPCQIEQEESQEQPSGIDESEVPKIGSGYVVSVSGKKGLRRLHRWGWCHRVPGVDYRHYVEYGEKCLGADLYDDFCHQCWRGGGKPSPEADVENDPSVASEDESSSTEGGD